jgi:hypothetical protein
MCREYNGWSNKQTWAVKLWIDNDGYAGGSDTVIEQAKAFLAEADGDKDQAVHELQVWLENAIDEDLVSSGVKTTGLFGDLLTDALETVFYGEIANAFVEDALNECG